MGCINIILLECINIQMPGKELKVKVLNSLASFNNRMY